MHGEKVGPRPRDPGHRNPRTQDLFQYFKGPGTPAKIQNLASGLPLKFESGTQGPPLKFISNMTN